MFWDLPVFPSVTSIILFFWSSLVALFTMKWYETTDWSEEIPISDFIWTTLMISSLPSNVCVIQASGQHIVGVLFSLVITISSNGGCLYRVVHLLRSCNENNIRNHFILEMANRFGRCFSNVLSSCWSLIMMIVMAPVLLWWLFRWWTVLSKMGRLRLYGTPTDVNFAWQQLMKSLNSSFLGNWVHLS